MIMKPPAIESAKRFINEHFPQCNVALLAGSASRGEETESSDLDIVVCDGNVSRCYRESLVRYGWRIECFIHNENSYLEQFEIDKKTGRATLATMVATGMILKDNGLAKTLKEQANQWISDGPPGLTEDFIQASRYFMYDLVDDFIDSKSREEELVTLNTISLQLADFILRLNKKWTGRGKGLVRELYKFDQPLADRFFDALQAYYKQGEKMPFVEFVNEIYEPLGGQLFDGFKQVRE